MPVVMVTKVMMAVALDIFTGKSGSLNSVTSETDMATSILRYWDSKKTGRRKARTMPNEEFVILLIAKVAMDKNNHDRQLP